MPDVAPYARAAFAQGWAASGGPMTERVKAGCVAAVALCQEHADDPDILEVALKLGSLEGTWALVFDRRDALIAKHTKLIQAAWNDTLRHVDVGKAVQRFRHAVGLREAQRDPSAVQAARDAVVTLLAWLPGTVLWQALREAMGNGLSAAVAEGKVGALALAFERSGQLGMDFDVAFNTAYDALRNLGQTWAQTDTWLARMLDRHTDELGQVLADLAAEGADYQDMVDAAEGLLTGVDGDAVAFIVDWALNTGLSQGALGLYRSEGIRQASWMTAGDNRVCAVCDANEQNSPFDLADFPPCPAHPRCRCTPYSDLSVSGSLEQYLQNA